MSKPGELRDDELTTIGTGVGTKPARLAKVAAAWFFRADAELRERFGFGIEYRSTGAYRTNADTAAIPGALPDGDHERGIALDVRNWGAFASIDPVDFRAILARNGWRNLDSTGKPFPREPWHHVCTKTAPPSAPSQKDVPMKVNKRKTSRPEWSLIHPSLVGDDVKQQGYVVTTDPARAREWERMYARGQGSADELERDDYIAQQDEARRVRAAWLKGQPVADVAALSDDDVARIARAVRAEIIAEPGA